MVQVDGPAAKVRAGEPVNVRITNNLGLALIGASAGDGTHSQRTEEVIWTGAACITLNRIHPNKTTATTRADLDREMTPQAVRDLCAACPVERCRSGDALDWVPRLVRPWRSRLLAQATN